MTLKMLQHWSNVRIQSPSQDKKNERIKRLNSHVMKPREGPACMVQVSVSLGMLLKASTDRGLVEVHARPRASSLANNEALRRSGCCRPNREVSHTRPVRLSHWSRAP